MKRLLFALAGLTVSAFANPELANIITHEYGAATTEGILLLQSAPSAAEPVQWSVFARDPFRQGDVVRANLNLEGRSWSVRPAGAGRGLLRRTPAEPINFSKVKVRSSEAREVASRAAAETNTVFATVEYQLAVDSPGMAPEWGIALINAAGAEVGFVLVNAENGQIALQNWANQAPQPMRNDPAATPGGRAAQGVKEAGRRAWDWTDNARRQTGNFFKELFR